MIYKYVEYTKKLVNAPENNHTIAIATENLPALNVDILIRGSRAVLVSK